MSYEPDLAFVHATAFADLATAAAPTLVSRVRALGGAERGGLVYDLGCGSGVVTAALSEDGFEVVGVDPSPAMIALARTSAPRASFFEASAYDVALKPCRAIVAIGEPLSYHPPDADAEAILDAFFTRAANALTLGGELVFDLVVTEGESLAGTRGREGDGWVVLSRTEEDRAARRITRYIDTFRRQGELYRRTHEIHHVRAFDASWIAASLERAGLRVETAPAYGSFALLPRRTAFFASRR